MAAAPSVLEQGDRAYLIRLEGGAGLATAARVHAVAAAVAALPGSGRPECIPGYVTVGVGWDGPDPGPDWPGRLRAAAEAALAGPPALARGRSLSVPVAYGGPDGPDLEPVAAAMGLRPAEVVARHAGRAYRVYFLGFAPGFAYLGEVDPRIAAPRLPAPRPAVPAGSVGVAGAQTGIYPRQSPGGWRLLGRTPLLVYDPGRAEPALLRPGDEVAFVPLAGPLPAAGAGAPRAWDEPGAEPALRVLRPGLLTTLQDLGRRGHQAEGVPESGAADAIAARLANRLTGNPDGAAVLEITALGPELAALAELAVAIVGADLGATVDGRPLEPGRVALLARGSVLALGGPRHGCRAYLAVAGGLAARPVLGSRCADLLGGLGPPPLRAGDVLAAHRPAGPPAALRGRRLRPGAYTLPPAGALTVQLLPGPQAEWFEEGWAGGERPVLPASDRSGLRLGGPPARRRAACADAELLSEANVLGAVQVPPGGGPLVLLAGRPTVGGYPKPGVVCSVDAWRLAQLLPGAASVRLERGDPAQARRRLAEAEAALDRAIAD